jgi:hypothetical protein
MPSTVATAGAADTAPPTHRLANEALIDEARHDKRREPNHLAIDPLGLPADTSVATTQLNIAPQSRAGVLARFPLQGFTGAQLLLVDATGKPLPPGTVITHQETGKRSW